MNILNVHNFKCNFSTLNVFTFFLKNRNKTSLNSAQIQCFRGVWVLTGCTPTAFHTEALVPWSRPQVEAVSNLKNQLGKEGNLSSTWCD